MSPSKPPALGAAKELTVATRLNIMRRGLAGGGAGKSITSVPEVHPDYRVQPPPCTAS
jgi:hypothetical protein